MGELVQAVGTMVGELARGLVIAAGVGVAVVLLLLVVRHRQEAEFDEHRDRR